MAATANMLFASIQNMSCTYMIGAAWEREGTVLPSKVPDSRAAFFFLKGEGIADLDLLWQRGSGPKSLDESGWEASR